MQFGYTIIYVRDVKKTVSFYQDAFKIECHFIDDSEQYAELNTGQTKLAFASEDLAKSNGVDFRPNIEENLSPGFEISLISENVKKDFEIACNSGATIIKQPTQKPWGQLVGYIKDLNGIIIEICSPMS